MPEKATLERARHDAEEGKSPSTQAGEFVREQMHHMHQGRRRGARSSKQAVAIGLSEARRSGVKLPPPKKGRTSARTRKKAAQDTKKGQRSRKVSSRSRSSSRSSRTTRRSTSHRRTSRSSSRSRSRSKR